MDLESQDLLQNNKNNIAKLNKNSTFAKKNNDNKQNFYND